VRPLLTFAICDQRTVTGSLAPPDGLTTSWSGSAEAICPRRTVLSSLVIVTIGLGLGGVVFPLGAGLGADCANTHAAPIATNATAIQ